MASHFVQEHARIQYAHQDELDDSIYREAIDFQEVLISITDPKLKAHIFKYQKDLNIYVLHFRQEKLTVEENLQRQNLQKEAKDQAATVDVYVTSECILLCILYYCNPMFIPGCFYYVFESCGHAPMFRSGGL